VDDQGLLKKELSEGSAKMGCIRTLPATR